MIRPDGSIELVARPGSITAALTIGSWIGVVILTSQWPDLFPAFAAIAVYLVVRWWRFPARRVVFDAAKRALRVVDRGTERQAAVPFSEIRSLTIEQRQPRRIANAPPVLVVNGDELLSVQDTHANANLERELQALVGLAASPSPRDREGVAGP